MSIDETYRLITILSMIGLLQSSLENVLVAIKYPAIYEFNLSKGLIKSSFLKLFAFAYESPGIWLFSCLKIVVVTLTLLGAIQGNIHTVFLLIGLLLDLILFPRTRYLSSSETPLQRVVIVTLIIHSYFGTESVSKIGLIFIVAQLFLAYFAAAFCKMKDLSWKNGNSVNYFVNENAERLEKKNVFWKLVAYGIILFESSFFLSLLGGNFLYLYLIMGLSFHLFISIKKGYNFFLWTFVSTYPAVHYVSGITEHFFMTID